MIISFRDVKGRRMGIRTRIRMETRRIQTKDSSRDNKVGIETGRMDRMDRMGSKEIIKMAMEMATEETGNKAQTIITTGVGIGIGRVAKAC